MFPNQFFFFSYCSYFYLAKHDRNEVPFQDVNGLLHSPQKKKKIESLKI